MWLVLVGEEKHTTCAGPDAGGDHMQGIRQDVIHIHGRASRWETRARRWRIGLHRGQKLLQLKGRRHINLLKPCILDRMRIIRVLTWRDHPRRIGIP